MFNITRKHYPIELIDDKKLEVNSGVFLGEISYTFQKISSRLNSQITSIFCWDSPILGIVKTSQIDRMGIW
jgi:hypothetical protein